MDVGIAAGSLGLASTFYRDCCDYCDECDDRIVAKGSGQTVSKSQAHPAELSHRDKRYLEAQAESGVRVSEREFVGPRERLFP